MTPQQRTALNRLQRAGDANSKTVEKLRDATQVTADYIISLFPERVGFTPLVRGYFIQMIPDADDAIPTTRDLCIPGYEPGIHYAVNHGSPLEVIYRFAFDCASELVSEIERHPDVIKSKRTS